MSRDIKWMIVWLIIKLYVFFYGYQWIFLKNNLTTNIVCFISKDFIIPKEICIIFFARSRDIRATSSVSSVYKRVSKFAAKAKSLIEIWTSRTWGCAFVKIISRYNTTESVFEAVALNTFETSSIFRTKSRARNWDIDTSSEVEKLLAGAFFIWNAVLSLFHVSSRTSEAFSS